MFALGTELTMYIRLMYSVDRGTRAIIIVFDTNVFKIRVLRTHQIYARICERMKNSHWFVRFGGKMRLHGGALSSVLHDLQIYDDEEG